MVRPWFSARMVRWLDRRLPPVSEVSLNRKNIFILPTRSGFLFLAATTLIFVTAINYVLSLAFGLAFLMTSLFILCIFHTFRNLQHLTLIGVGAEPVFAGQDAAFVVALQGEDRHAHELLELRFPKAAWTVGEVMAGSSTRVKVFLPSTRRGPLRAPRLQVQTRFPLGLWRAFSNVDLDMSTLVYPAPLACELPSHVAGAVSGKADSLTAGVEDFHGIRAYQQGDSLKQIAWKNLARGQALAVKQFVDLVDEQLMLDWDMFAGIEQEERLSRLCYWVLQLSRQQIAFGVRLPGVSIPLGQGDAHRHRVLTALALWQTGEA